jgi:hypothetical protein
VAILGAMSGLATGYQVFFACHHREGLWAVNVNGTESIIEGGSPEADKPVCIPPGVVHYFWCARNDTALRIDVPLQPPGNTIDFFRTLIGASTEMADQLVLLPAADWPVGLIMQCGCPGADASA